MSIHVFGLRLKITAVLIFNVIVNSTYAVTNGNYSGFSNIPLNYPLSSNTIVYIPLTDPSWNFLGFARDPLPFGFVCADGNECPTTVSEGSLGEDTGTSKYLYGTPINVKITSDTHPGVTVNLKLIGSYVATYGNDSSHRIVKMNKYLPITSDRDYNGFVYFNLSLPVSSSIYPNIPSGEWTATLRLNAVGVDQRVINTATLNIRLLVTHKGSQKIYFPAFPYSSPQVSLKLNTRPGAKLNTVVSGSNSLDMCLYDGDNSSSPSINLLFSDEGASATGRPAGEFSVYRDGADKTQATNRIDYQVSVINPTTGAAQPVSNGTQITWTNTNQRNIQRQVVIPGVAGVSLCVPAPITLTTPGFTMADKAAGHYTGKLTVLYTPST